jgi:phage terminase Nu1 subunit (DNA packaging protein)
LKVNAATGGADVKTVARELNLSASSVHRLAQEPSFPPKLSVGVFNLPAVTRWYVRYLQAALERRGPSGTVETASILRERKRLLTAQADRAEKENAIRRGDYLSAEAIQIVWMRQLTNARKRLLAMPQKLAPLLVNKAAAAYIAEEIKREIYRVLTELASGGATGTGATGTDAPTTEGNP